MTIEILIGIFVPFIGTTAGAAMALLFKKNVSPTVNKLLSGFSAGVMLAASVWSLIMPSVEMAEERGTLPFVPATVGIIAGVAALIVIDILLPQTGRKNKMMVFAVTVHNVPEGMAVGAVLAGLLAGSDGITFAAALSLSIGIGLQNIPEGAIVGLPLVGEKGKPKAFAVGVLSGAVEPIAAAITIALYVIVVAILPYLLALAAGAMIYVVAKELIPEIEEGSVGIIGLTLGFVLMMIMDLML